LVGFCKTPTVEISAPRKKLQHRFCSSNTSNQPYKQ
jgi:hypothetical protein